MLSYIAKNIIFVSVAFLLVGCAASNLESQSNVSTFYDSSDSKYMPSNNTGQLILHKYRSLDHNKNGVLTLVDIEKTSAKSFKSEDLDNSGSLSQDEFLKLNNFKKDKWKGLNYHMGFGHNKRKESNILSGFKRADVDKNNELSISEYAKSESIPLFFADINKDGAVSNNELIDYNIQKLMRLNKSIDPKNIVVADSYRNTIVFKDKATSETYTSVSQFY